MSTRHIALALSALLTLGCSTPKKQEVLNGPPANDPIRVVDETPQDPLEQLSDDPAMRRSQLLSSCYASTLLREKARTLGGRSHIVLLSADASGGDVEARFAPPTHGSVNVFDDCVTKHVESGLYPVPEEGVFVSQAVEATRINTRQGEVTDIVSMPTTVGAISKQDWTASNKRTGAIVDECIDVKLGTTKYPDFTILLTHEVPTSGEGGAVAVFSSWTQTPPSFLDCVRRASALILYSETNEDELRQVRHVVTVAGN